MKKSIIAVGLLLPVVAVFLFLSKTSGDDSAGTEIVAQEQTILSVYKLPVIGTAKSTSDITIYAKTFGEVKEMPIRRGDIVSEGSYLLGSTNPVLQAEYSSVSFAEIIRGLENDKYVTASRSSVSINEASLNELTSLSSLAVLSDAERIEEMGASITTSLQEVQSTVPELLRFYQDARTSLTGDSVDILREVSTELYGNTPQYLQINSIISSSNYDGIFQKLDLITNKERAELIPRLLLVIQKIGVAHSKSEKNFYTDFSVNDINFKNYISNIERIYTITKKLQADHTRWRELLDSQSSANIQRDSEAIRQHARLEDSQIQSKIIERIQDTQVNLSQSNLQRVAEEIALGVVVAPYNGTITETYVNVGSIVQRGTPIARLITTDATEAYLTVPHEVANTLSVGESLYSNDTVIGTIRSIGNIRKGKTVEVIVDLNAKIKVGETVRGEFRIDTHSTPELKIVRRSDILFIQNRLYIQNNVSKEGPIKIISDSGNFILVNVQ
jgi:multidrug efflux pump subunit AcrA (membrane-fusion protein)